MDDAECLIAFRDCADDQAEAENIGELLKADRLALHLAPDRIGALAAPRNHRRDAAVGQPARQLILNLRDQAQAAIFQRGQPLGDDAKALRVELLEGEVLQLVAHLLHAHAAGQRRIDVDGLLGGAAAGLRRHVAQGAHVVQAVSQLDQQDANVVGDRQQQLAQVLGLLGFAGDEIEPLQLGQPLDQMADIVAEQLIDFGPGGSGILDGVMQERGGDGRIIELEFGQDRGDFQRMREIGIARGTLLLAMGLHGVDVGAIEQCLIGFRIVPAHAINQIVLPHHWRLLGFS